MDTATIAWNFNEAVSLLREARETLSDGSLKTEIDDALPDIQKALESTVPLTTRENLMDTLGIPADRRHEFHVVTVKEDSWHMAHPITCELASCVFDAAAQEWDEPPYALGIYHWTQVGLNPVLVNG